MVINYNSFSGATGLILNGNASLAGNALRLTPDAKIQRGSVFADTALAIGANTSFSTNFQFQITGAQGTNGADGMTFLLQNSSRGAAAIGDWAGQLGYGGGNNSPAIEKSLAIKFDTWANPGESSNNFVGVNLNGVAIGSVSGAVAPVDLNNGSVVNVWIDYNGANDNLAVYLSNSTSKPTAALINYTVDLANVVGNQAYAGFTAATGGAPNIHDILKWQLDSSTSTPTPTPTPTPAPSSGPINYADFSSVSGLKLNGNASQSGNALQLTPDATRQAGTAFSTTPIAFNADTSFSTNFQFRITGAQGTNGADGMTFLLQNSGAGVNALGDIGGQLGYGAGTAINKSLAIKFDTWANPGESSNNFVGVNLNGVAIGSVAGAVSPFDLNGGSPLNVWVDYNGATDNLAVYLSNGTTKPTSALINYTVDLASILGNQAFVGFSAATGGAPNVHQILNWTFDTSVPTTPPPIITPPSTPPPSSGYTSAINYNDFSSLSGIKVNGSASQSGNALRLTPLTNGVAGSAFATSPIAIYGDTSFQTNFKLRLSGGQGTKGADGAAFVIQNSSDGFNALGGAGGNLGLTKNNSSLAIKFDTWQGSGELSDNFVGVVRGASDGNSIDTIAAQNAPFDLNGDNTVLNVWVDYTGTNDNLKVYLSNQSSKPTSALIDLTVRLSNIVGSQAFVGFSAGTGGAPNNQDVLSWNFSTSTPAPPAVQPGIARILPLGDSITLGVAARNEDANRTNIPGGYRRVLWNKLTDAGISVDFVGSETDGDPSRWNNGGDRNNQGMGGWTIDKISANVINYLSRENPNIVTLKIGTNNFITDSTSQMIDKLSALIDKITAFSPTIKLLVASIPPIHPDTDERADAATQQQQVQRVTDYNNAMPGLISNKRSQGKNVDFVDMRSLTVADLAPRNQDSGVHPSMAGYDKIGNLWYNALLDPNKVGRTGNTLKVG